MSEFPDPVSIYLSVLQQVEHCKATGSKLTPAESSQSFGMLMYACSQLIHQNQRLRESNAISDQLIEELEIDVAVKDIEIFSMRSQFPGNPQDTPPPS